MADPQYDQILAHLKLDGPRRRLEYCVYQFFPDGSWSRVRSFVSIEDALEAFEHYTSAAAAADGIVTRVIVTDGGDCINYEWRRGRGMTYPPSSQVGES